MARALEVVESPTIAGNNRKQKLKKEKGKLWLCRTSDE